MSGHTFTTAELLMLYRVQFTVVFSGDILHPNIDLEEWFRSETKIVPYFNSIQYTSCCPVCSPQAHFVIL
jgi:hypothetical protein